MKTRLLSIINSPWALTPCTLREVRDIYVTHLRGEKIDVAGIEARIGRPLEREPESYSMHDGVAVVPVHGMLAQRMNLFTQVSGGVSTQVLGDLLMRLADDETVDSIVLDFDSPGGEVHGTQELAQLVREIGEMKSVVAFSDSMMTSGAYWIGSAAHAVFISGDNVQTGSIGVVATHVDYSERERADGVKVTEITAGRYKRVASSHAPLTEEGRSSIQEMVDHTYSIFVDDVATNRGVATERVLESMAEGRIFQGRQAIEAGLVDGVSTLRGIIAGLQDGSLLDGDGDDPGRATTDVTHEDQAMELSTLTEAELREARPDLVEAITSGVDVAAIEEQGATRERERIRDVRAQSLPGHEALIEEMCFDGKTSGAEAAVRVLQAERAASVDRAAALDADAPDAVDASEPPPDDAPDFDALVASAIAEGASRAEAIRAVAEQHPEAHAAMLRRAQKRKRAA